jgi:excinuclease UvrABC ATPase subunit
MKRGYFLATHDDEERRAMRIQQRLYTRRTCNVCEDSKSLHEANTKRLGGKDVWMLETLSVNQEYREM